MQIKIYCILVKILIMSHFFCNGMRILNIDRNNVNLDNNFDEDYSDTIVLIRLLAWHIRFEKCKAFKKELNEELMPIYTRKYLKQYVLMSRVLLISLNQNVFNSFCE